MVHPFWRGLVVYGAAVLYCSLCFCRRRATWGQRLCRWQVMRLDRRRLSLWQGFERFMGFLGAPGTLGLGFLDLGREPNRRLAHGRLAHKAVVRVRPAAGKNWAKPRATDPAPSSAPSS
ncbi:MAG: hypothetical protein NZ869_05470 [Thermoanaerobaculum sp.]|nr:hypothetical protein [Thermoanaerobaculum sp.]MCX7895006.1 hypothetical protein [Thermoanaerobaculum sp.]MDW7967963.1 hypothetical protein [Thermoanaerobaculum sp.]